MTTPRATPAPEHAKLTDAEALQAMASMLPVRADTLIDKAVVKALTSAASAKAYAAGVAEQAARVQALEQAILTEHHRYHRDDSQIDCPHTICTATLAATDTQKREVQP